MKKFYTKPAPSFEKRYLNVPLLLNYFSIPELNEIARLLHALSYEHWSFHLDGNEIGKKNYFKLKNHTKINIDEIANISSNGAVIHLEKDGLKIYEVNLKMLSDCVKKKEVESTSQKRFIV